MKMKNFGIQKYFISIEHSYRMATGELKNLDEKAKNSPIMADNKLLISELRLIERAVEEKRKWLLGKFLKENNILLQDIVADLQNRLNRPNENGKKYVRRLLWELQSHREKALKGIKWEKTVRGGATKNIQKTNADEVVSISDTSMNSWNNIPLPEHSIWMKSNKEIREEKYNKDLAEVKARYHELDGIIKNSRYYAIKNPVYFSMNEMNSSSYDEKAELKNFFKNNPHIYRAVMEQEKILHNFGSDVLNLSVSSRGSAPWNTYETLHTKNDNNENQNHPDIPNVQIIRSGNGQWAEADSINIHQQWNNQEHYINNIHIQ